MDNKEQLIKSVPSAVNKELKVVMYKGKKLLNTENTNYSYGTLVDVLEYGVDTLPIESIKSILLLGMGAASIVESLREKYYCYAPVTGVELDPVVINLAHEEFDIDQLKDLEIHNMDAWDFVEQSDKEYDLIIIDIFIDVRVPKRFYDPKFWSMLERSVAPNGFVLFNAGIDLEEEDVEKFIDTLPDSFIAQENYNVLVSNTVIMLQKVFF